jgi:ABC-2 type transport system permease protein
MAGLAAYTVLFLYTLNKRLHAQYLGENLSEAPAASVRVNKKAGKPTQATVAAEGPGFAPFSPAVTALLIKEFRYLIRSGPKLYSLVVPIFMVFIFSSRNSGLAFIGFGDGSREAFVFTYGCLYLQLLLVAMLYNSLGGDASGVQFYFMAPMRLRDVLLAKNLLAAGIFLVEVVLIYAAASTLSVPPSLDLAVATVAGSLYTFILGMSIGNIRSLVQPKVIDPTKVRRQNLSGLNGLISLLTTAVCGAIGGLLLAGSRYLSGNYWIAALVMIVLVAVSAVVYWMVYGKLDSIALDNQEAISSELCKA